MRVIRYGDPRLDIPLRVRGGGEQKTICKEQSDALDDQGSRRQCDREAYALGLCRPHYFRAYRAGNRAERRAAPGRREAILVEVEFAPPSPLWERIAKQILDVRGIAYTVTKRGRMRWQQPEDFEEAEAVEEIAA